MSISHGILMSAEMVCAYQLGRKGQTRRTRGLDIVNKKPDDFKFIGFDETKPYAVFEHRLGGCFFYRMPYGRIGDTLWFRETWKMWERDDDGKDFLHYRADDAKVDPIWWNEDDWVRPDPVWRKKDVFKKWQPSMFMPKLCCRHRDVDVLNVRVERLQDISNIDAVCEGFPIDVDKAITPRQWYRDLWDKINGESLMWVSNPWIWVYEFPKYHENI